MVQVEELECGCCYELLVEPTTLTCGHSFCRYCLAKWQGMSESKTCPECRQVWTGFPRVNIHLRTIIEKSYQKELKERHKSIAQYPDYQKTLKTFDYDLDESNVPTTMDHQQFEVMLKILFVVAVSFFAIALLAFLYYLFQSGPRTSEIIYQKTVDKWSTTEVAAWVQEISTKQLDEDYSERFSHAKIVGQLLLTLTEQDLASSPLNIQNALHRKMLAAEIQAVNHSRLIQPKTLWDYKKAHGSNALFLLFLAQEYPRLTFVYLYYMEYHTIYLPFVNGVMGSTQNCSDHETTHNNTHCFQGGYKFYMRILLIPFVMIGQFCTSYIHGLTMWIIISQCALLTCQELIHFTRLPPLSESPHHLFNNTVSFVLTILWYWTVLTITPSFICDVVFYVKLYYGPIDTAKSIHKGSANPNIVWQIIDGCKLTCQGLWHVIWFVANQRIDPN